MKTISLFSLFLTSILSSFAQTLPTPPEGTEWSENLIVNPTLSSNDLSSFQGNSGASYKIVVKDGRKALEVVSNDYREHEWDSQFFLNLGEQLREGEQLYVSFSYRAEHSATCKTEAQSKPGSYNHWEMLGNIDFTTSWKTYEWRQVINAEQAGNDGLGTIAFNLNYNGANANKFYFRDFRLHKLIPKGSDCSQLVINEIQVSNNDLFIDPSLNYGGWIELYNPGLEDAFLGGLYVSDEPDNPKKFRLPVTAGVVPAHGFKNIWFDHNARDGSFSDQADCQVPFRLSMEGGDIYLSDTRGHVLQHVCYPPAIPRCSYALAKDGGTEWGTTGVPTPEKTNAGSPFATERLEMPVVSCDGGVYNQGEKLSFSVEIPAGATLLYTTDGSTPTPTRGTKTLTGHFTVDATKVYRFRLFADDKLPSPVVTRSFIFRNHDYYLPVLSIATLPDNLFSPKIGVYVRGVNGIDGRGQSTPCNWNRDWERPVNMEYFVPQQNTEGDVAFLAAVNQELGFEICGGWSRGFGAGTTDNRQWEARSSFRLKTNKMMDGPSDLPYAVFPDKPYNKYKAWQVRNGGNDETHRTKDPILQQIVLTSGIDVDCQDYQPCHVFFNGIYVGMLNIREASNKQFGYSNFGIDTDDMDQMENWGNVKVGDRTAWDELLNRASRLANSQSASDYEAVRELLAVDEFINYMAVECYFGGSDWLTNTNNVKWYRSRSDGGKFRFVMFDVDSAMDGDNFSMFSSVVDNGAGGDVGKLFGYLVRYVDFRHQFLDAMCLVEGSVLHPSRTTEISESVCNQVSEALAFESLNPGRDMVDKLNKRYMGKVVSNLVGHKLYNGISAPYRLRVSSNIEPGQLLLNGRRMPTDKFDGRVYDYAGKGLHLTAQAPAGYRFLGWEQQSSQQENVTTLISQASNWDYYDQGSMDAYGWKETEFNPSSHGWKTDYRAPFGFGNSGTYPQANSNTKLDYGGNANDKRPTYYFRTRFYVDHQPTGDEVFRLYYQVDDGFAFYINGKYINGYRMTEKDANYHFVTTEWAGTDPDEGSFDIDPADITLGWNTLAVEVHNNSLTSSDIFWDCQLQRSTFTPVNRSMLSSSPSLCLSAMEAGEYNLVATYARITDQHERYEAGGSPIRVNEVSAANDIYINDHRKKNDWVELYNTTDEDIDLAGLYLSDNARKPQKWQIASTVASTIIPAHGTRIIWCDDLQPISQLHAPFKLDNADGACVCIQAADGTWADRLTYLSQARWQTYGRYPDGGNFTSLLSMPSIDRTNYQAFMDLANYEPAENNEAAITLAMAQGWNWTSHNLAEDVHVSRFSYFAQELRSQTQHYLYDKLSGWQGELKTVEQARGYKMQMKEAADITLRGQIYDCTQPIHLQRGWNWIGIPLRNATELNAAMKHYVPTVGDLIVGHDAFATYEDGEWVGTLTSLEPGQAYLLKTGQEQAFEWNDLSRGRRIRERRYEAAQREDNAPWNLDIHAKPNVATMIAKLDSDEPVLPVGYFVGAFCGDECRGVAREVDGLLFMNIHIADNEEIHFRLLDGEGNLYTAPATELIHDMQCLGSLSSPYPLHFSPRDVEDIIQVAQTRHVHPVSIQYFNLNGQRISHPEGICLQHIQLSDGTTQVKKIMGK